MMSLDNFVSMYLDWVNNFLTVEAFAEHYSITEESAQKIIDCGRLVSNLELKPELY